MYCSYIFLLIFYLCVTVNAEDTTIYENYSSDLQCNQPNTGIYINKAQWSYDMSDVRNMFMPSVRNFAFLWGKAANMCVYDEIEAVKRLCHGKNKCSITANRQTFSDACSYWMMLEISYECKPCSHRGKRQAINLNFFCDFYIPLPDKTFEQCPNQRFLVKHVCQSAAKCGDDVTSAAIFATEAAKLRDKYDLMPTTKQTVFMAASGMHYYEKYNYCQFSFGVPKYDCFFNELSKSWDCERKGVVKASHEKYSGHYMRYMDELLDVNY